MSQRVPILKPGDRITAARQNLLGRFVNDELAARLRDVDDGLEEAPPGFEDAEVVDDTEEATPEYSEASSWSSVVTASQIVRVYQNGDPSSENYVDIERATQTVETDGFDVRTITWIW